MSLIFFLILLFFIYVVVSSLDSRLRPEYEDQDCLKLLPLDYKIYKAPKVKGEPLNVTFHMNIHDVDEINEENMDFRLHGYIYTNWFDERLNISKTNISYSRCSKHVWTPDVIFETAKETRTFGHRNAYFFINERKKIHSVERYAFKIGCLMYFKDYPFDTQHCVFSIVLMSHSNKEVRIQWGNTTDLPPVFLNRKIEPLQFSLKDPTVGTRLVPFVYGVFPYLDIKIILVRRLMGSIVNIYAPSTLVVAVSWVTFWLRVEAAPARVSLSITSLLTLCTQIHQNKSQLPSLNYITAVDIWLFMCIFMVFSTLIEFAICYNTYMEMQERNKQHPNKTNNIQPEAEKITTTQQETKINSWTETKTQNNDNSVDHAQQKRYNCFCSSSSSDVSGMDATCRKLFPLSFILFAMAYWLHYLIIYNAN